MRGRRTKETPTEGWPEKKESCWPAFEETVRAGGFNPRLVECPKEFRNHGTVLFAAFKAGHAAGYDQAVEEIEQETAEMEENV